MLALDTIRQRTADPPAVIRSQTAFSYRAGNHVDGRSPVSSKCEEMKGQLKGSSIPSVGQSIAYLLEKEGDALRRLRVIAAKLGLALMLCDEKGRSVAIDEPAEKLASGGIPPKALQRVCDYIERNLDRRICLDDLAQVTGLSRCHFVRAFKQSVGTTPHCYLMRKRVEVASALLRETDIPLAQIALQCGFSDQSHLCRSFRMFLDSTPRVFRRYHR